MSTPDTHNSYVSQLFLLSERSTSREATGGLALEIQGRGMHTSGVRSKQAQGR